MTNKSTLRSINEKNVLQQIFNHGPISRSQVSKNLTLNKVTVSDIFNHLLARDYLRELGTGESGKNGGRRPTMLQFNAKHGYTISFSIAPHTIERMVNYLDGSIIQYDRYEELRLAPSELLDFITHKVAEISITDTTHGLLGLSFAIYGIVFRNRILYSPFVDFGDLELAPHFEELFSVPVVIENEANLSVIYDRDFAGGHDNDNIVSLSIHQGIGAGIIINHQLYRGVKGEAGEIGNSVVYHHQADGQVSLRSIEEFCSEEAIIERARKATHNPYLQRQDLATLYNQQNESIVTILDDFAFYCASVIHNTIVSFDPRHVVVNSPLLAEIPALLTKIKENIRFLTAEPTTVKLIDDVRNGILLGGCSEITHRVLAMEGYQLLFKSSI